LTSNASNHVVSGPSASDTRVSAHHVAVGEHVGAADLDDPPRARRCRQRCDKIRDHVTYVDRLDTRRHPLRSDHHRQTLGEITHHLERHAARPDDDRRAKLRDGNARRAEQRSHLVTAAEMARKGRAVVTETAEIHDPFDPGAARSFAEDRRRFTVAARKIASRIAHRVDQVIRNAAPLHGGDQTGAVENVALGNFGVLKSVGEPRGVAGETTDGIPGFRERRDQPAADVAGRAGNQNTHHWSERARTRKVPRGLPTVM